MAETVTTTTTTTTAAAVPLLSVENVRKYYEVRRGVLGAKLPLKAVDDVTFDIRRGEIFGVVGESGCGKSTLGRLICRLERVTAGRIALDGRDLTGIPERDMRPLRRRVQMIFQDPYASLNPRMSVGRIVAEPLVVHRMASTKAELSAAVAALLDDVGLAPEYAARYPHEFSGGQRQRIGIARALAVKPDLIVADEPLSALDVSIQSQVLNLMNRIKDEHNLTFVFISHNLTVVEFFSDRIGVMYLGSLVEIASKDRLYQNPLHPYTQGLLQAIPVLDPTARKERRLLEGSIPSAVNPPPGCKFHTRCPRCLDKCRTEAPPRVEVSEDQTVYCHLYG